MEEQQKKSDTKAGIIGLAAVGFVVYLIFSGSKNESPTLPSAPAPSAVQAQIEKDKAEAASTPLSLDRPAAKYSSNAEWEAIQHFCSALWKVSTQTSKAHDKLMKRLKASMRNIDSNAMANALDDYQKALNAEGDAIDKIEPPDVQDADTAKFMAAAIEHLQAQNIIEGEKTAKFMAGLRTGTPISDEESVRLNHEANGHMSLFVTYLSRIYWNYGYQSSDIEDATFRIKKNAVQSATTSFSRS